MYLRTYRPASYFHINLKSEYIPTDDGTLYEPRPEGQFNSDGIRDDRDYTAGKPGNTYRIQIIGDSVPFGLGIDSSQTFSKQLAEKLEATNASGLKYEVMNLGVPGYNISQTIYRLKKTGLKYSPDMIIYWHWLNDSYVSDWGWASALNNPVLQFFQDISDKGGSQSKSRITRIQSKLLDLQTTRFLIEQLHKITDRRLIQKDPDMKKYEESVSPEIRSVYDGYAKDFTNGVMHDLTCCEQYHEQYTNYNTFTYWNYYVREFSDICRENNVQCIVLLTPVLYTHEKGNYAWSRLNTFIKDIARTHGLVVFDLTETFEEYDGVTLRNNPVDPTHPNYLANTIVADEVFRKFFAQSFGL